jgi:excisionase family DNA binding protein
MTQPLLSVEDVAAYLGVPVATVYAWNSKDIGPKRHRVGRHVRYRQADVDAWLDKQAVSNSLV